MKKIKWIRLSPGFVQGKVGSFLMYCERFKTRTGLIRWYASCSLCGNFVSGPNRKSLDETKDDAVRIIKEAMVDYQICITAEMEKLGMADERD